VLRDVDEILLPGITHWQSPRFFAYFAVSAAEPGILAELLAATLNSVAILWRTSPASTELEAVTLDWVAQLLGLPDDWHGHIEDTASTSTIAALAAAREATGRNVVVCSEHAHSSVDKAAKLLGMELRKTPADEDFRLRIDALDIADAAVVVATVGTTSTASVDPVPRIADACAAAGAWLHVDAAYAGSAWVCPEFRWSQEGVERADTLVVNAHKWLFTPMDCSLLWTSRPDDLRRAFSLVPEYLRTGDDVDSLSEYGPALGRRSVPSSSGQCSAATAARGYRRGFARRCGWRRSSKPGYGTNRAGRSARRDTSHSSVSVELGATRRTRASSSGSIGAARPFFLTPGSGATTSSAWPSAMNARLRPTSSGYGMP
jgi:aromatic-L-amino-acid decarboxylase